MQAHTAREIMSQIKERANRLEEWTIGTTDDPDPHRRVHKFRGSWRIWQAESAEEAREVVHYFVENGMKQDDERREMAAPYVYIF